MSLHLIATADERTWKFDCPVLFLGEWCKIYNRRDVWRRMDSSTLNHVWLNFDEFEKDYYYMESLYERLLPNLGRQLNEIHGVSHGSEYWRVVVGPWLATFMHIAYERWRMITHALENHNITSFAHNTRNEMSHVPLGMDDFHKKAAGDVWNEFIYLSVLKHQNALSQIEAVKLPEELSEGFVHPKTSKSVWVKLLEALKQRIAKVLVSKRDFFMISTYVPFERLAVLQLHLGQFPFRWGGVSAALVAADMTARNWKLDAEVKNSFEDFFGQLVPKQIPTIFLEGYKNLLKQVFILPWPKNPKYIFTSNSLWADEPVMVYTAAQVESGSKLIYGQHGGLYGVGIFSWAEKHELDIADRYLTWGWVGQPKDKFVPVGYFKRKLASPVDGKPNGKLVLVCYEYPRYTHRFESETMVMLAGYIDNCLKFGGLLSQSVRDNLLVRLTPRESGWYQESRWKDQLPEVPVDRGQRPMRRLMLTSRLLVYTYNSTGFLEAFVSGIPCIMFWDPGVSRLRPAAIPYFDDLKAVGILHESPQGAAAHVLAVWNDVGGWWGSPPVQAALQRFCSMYCNDPDVAHMKLQKFLKNNN